MGTSLYERALAKRADRLLHPAGKVAITGTAADLEALNRIISPEVQRLPGSVAALAQLGMEMKAMAQQSLGNGHADEAVMALTESVADRPQG